MSVPCRRDFFFSSSCYVCFISSDMPALLASVFAYKCSTLHSDCCNSHPYNLACGENAMMNNQTDRLRRMGFIRHLESNEDVYVDKIRLHLNTAKYATNGIVTDVTLLITKNGFRDELLKWPEWQKIAQKALLWHPNPKPILLADFLCDYIFSNHALLKRITS